MCKARKQVVASVENVMDCMVAGERHSLHEIVRQVNARVPNVQKVLAECVSTGLVNMAFADNAMFTGRLLRGKPLLRDESRVHYGRRRPWKGMTLRFVGSANCA